MSQEIDFDAQEIKSLETWLRRTFSDFSRRSSKEVGRTIDIDIQSLALKGEDEIRPEVPSDGFTWGIQVPGAEGHIFALVGRAVALSLSRPTDDAEGALADRLADDASFSDEEKAAIQSTQDLLCQSLVEVAKSSASSDTLESYTDLIEASAWASGNDPIGPGTMVVATIQTTIDGGDAEAGLVLLSPALIQEQFSATLTATASASESGESGDYLFYPASSSMKEHITAQFGSPPQECETVAELMRGFVNAGTSGVVVGVNKGEEHILALLRGMKELPDCQDKAIVIVLEESSAANVVRCGRLGLFSVLPKDFTANDLTARLSRPE